MNGREAAIGGAVSAEGLQKRRVDFEKPPVAETSLGFYFAKIPRWNILHYGMLWERFRRKYPDSKFLPPIIRSQPELSLNLPQDTHQIPVRACFEDKSKTELVQVQSDLFLRNWRKTPSTQEYQHYDLVLPRLEEDWRLFCNFLKEQSIEKPDVLLCEMSYFNQLERGKDWQDFTDVPEIFPVWKGFSEDSIFTNPKAVAFSISTATPRGQVTVVVQPGIRKLDGKEILQATLTASNKPVDSEDVSLFECLNRCHENAVESFIQIASEQAQRQWGRKS